MPFLSPMHFGEDWNCWKVICSLSGRSGFAFKILPYWGVHNPLFWLSSSCSEIDEFTVILFADSNQEIVNVNWNGGSRWGRRSKCLQGSSQNWACPLFWVPAGYQYMSFEALKQLSCLSQLSPGFSTFFLSLSIKGFPGVNFQRLVVLIWGMWGT